MKRNRTRNKDSGFWKSVIVISFIGLVVSSASALAIIVSDQGDKDVLIFEEEDVQFLNRIYKDYENETAYCGIIYDDTVDVEVATMTESNLRSVMSIRTECSYPFGFNTEHDRKVAMHTHPVGSSVFSEADKEYLVKSNVKYTCIQYDVIDIDSKEGLRCIKEGYGENEFKEVEISFVRNVW